jgi:hypothetical protein
MLEADPLTFAVTGRGLGHEGALLITVSERG